MKTLFSGLFFLVLNTVVIAQETSIILTRPMSVNHELIVQEDTIVPIPSLVDYDAFAELVKEVDTHRKARIVSFKQFNEMAQQPDVIILDTRSKEMYDAKHVKGAIHLNFSDFTQDNLAALIPSTETKIMIYCNNNFDDDQKYFASKVFIPRDQFKDEKQLTLALNIPTYINLYGYGYRNVYELGELISVFDDRMVFEGTAVGTVLTTPE